MNEIKKRWVTYQEYEININELLYFKLTNFNKVVFVFSNGQKIKVNFDFNQMVKLKEELRKWNHTFIKK